MKIKTIGIIGYGNFGALLHQILQKTLPNIQIKINSRSIESDGQTFFNFEEVCQCDVVIPSVPINKFEDTITRVAEVISRETIVFEVCSVKVWPKQVLLKHLPNHQIICTHPMFGPESYKKTGGSLKNFKMIVENVSCNEEIFSEIKSFLKEFELDVIEMSADEHDSLAAVFHFTTLFVGNMVREIKLTRTAIDTYSASLMHDFAEIVGGDLGILKDMYDYNPYCKDQMKNLENSFETIKHFIVTN